MGQNWKYRNGLFVCVIIARIASTNRISKSSIQKPLLRNFFEYIRGSGVLNRTQGTRIFQ